MADSPSKYRRTIGKCRIVVALLAVSLVAVIVAFAVVAVHLHKKAGDKASTCASNSQQINTDQPAVLTPFYDLTASEVSAVQTFLYQQDDLDLVRPADIRCNLSYIYTMELKPPVKQEAIDFLDRGGKRPPREAKVVIFQGSKSDPFIQEYVVGPLPNPVYFRPHGSRIPFIYRPLTAPELGDAITILKDQLHAKVSHVLEESYGATIKDCGDRCLDIKILSAMSTASSGELNSRKMWLWLSQDVEFYTLHPLDLQVLMDLTGKTSSQYRIEKVVYGGTLFGSLEELAKAYDDGVVTKTKIPFPVNDDKLFSSLHRRGQDPDTPTQQPPVEMEPNGVRYSVNGRKISYRGWEFHLRMSTITGPQLYDVRFKGERIAYEMSLQELAVFYSADNPAQRFADYVDSVTLLGMRSRGIVPGVDCPQMSTFLSASHVYEGSEEMVTNERTFCVFEHNTGIPLRRHLAHVGETGKFFEGMADTVLTVRNLITAVNYDYVIDFIFHQNGVINVKVTSVGYIITSFRFQQTDDRYGWQLGDHITGNIHHHLFNFKVDLDIKGEMNRFETLDLKAVEVDNTKWSTTPKAKYSQTRMYRTLKATEKAAALKYNFDTPKYLTFYNRDTTTEYGVPRSYRLLMRGMSKQLIAEGQGQEPAVSWGRYQLAVTKREESELQSSSMYAIWDAANPVVNFTSFIDDDDSIVDQGSGGDCNLLGSRFVQDQVAWVTMGIHHIPHMEDLPVTHTPGLDLNFFLIPHNYFDEDPAMASGDAVRIEPKDQRDLSQGVSIERYGQTENAQCTAPPTTFDQDVEDNPQLLFDPFVPGSL